MKVAAKAENQTDARCYLAGLLTRPVQVTIDGQTETRRVVNRGYDFFHSTGDLSVDAPFSGQRYEVAFWDKEHGLVVGNDVKIELKDAAEPRSSLVQILEGHVMAVEGHEVSIWGSDLFDIKPEDENASEA